MVGNQEGPDLIDLIWRLFPLIWRLFPLRQTKLLGGLTVVASAVKISLKPRCCFQGHKFGTASPQMLLPPEPGDKVSASTTGDQGWLPTIASPVIPVTQIWHTVATLPDAWRYRVSARTGWPCVSRLWLREIASLICNFYLSVAACAII